ncbi:MAG: PAS domain S-box protein, partial [Brevundimonas sp.]
MSFTPAHSPDWTEGQRLEALASYDILDTGPEAGFDELVELASEICGAPIALVSLVDVDRQWFKARIGLDDAETARDVSFCQYAMLGQGPMVVNDATVDPRFKDNALVTGGPRIGFYAGAPLKSRDGVPLGSLCVIDTQPRPEGLTPIQTRTLEVLSHQVMAQLELRRALRERQRSEDATRRALAASQYVGAWDWDIEADRVMADPRFAAMYGVDIATAATGAPIAFFTDAIHPDDAERVQAEIERAMETLGHFESEYRLVADGKERWVLARGQVYADALNAPSRFPGVIIDITARKKVETELASTVAALKQSEAGFRALADSMPQMVWSTHPDGFHDYYNARWYEFTGVAPGSTDGEGWNEIFHPEDRARAWEIWRRSLETGDPYEIEYRLRHHSGVYRWTLGRASAVRDETGQITRWFGTCTDIDDLKRVEQGKELLSQELSHRIKNIFAVVSALAALSARQFPEAKAFAASLRTRINALARAHEFVRPHSETSRPIVGSMTLHAFLGSLFRPYADENGLPRVRVSGDDAVFDDQAATSVALLFHELATNAAKYGALTTPHGQVDLTTEADDDRYRLIWQETGGPTITAAPEGAGFGTALATLSVEGQLGGKLTREWRAEGLRIVADLPRTALSRRR